MKRYFMILLLLLSFISAQAELSKYQFNFGRIKLKDCILEHKRDGVRVFTGIVDNRKPWDLNWIKLKFYFRDKNFNHGRYTLVSTKFIRNIPKSSHKEFKLYLPLGQVDGRDFKVELVDYKESR